MGARLSYIPTYNSATPPKPIGSLTSIGEFAPEAEEIDATCLDSAGGYKEFMQGFKDSGELPVTGFHDKMDTGQAQARTLFTSGATGYFFVEMSDSTFIGFNAYIKSHSIGSAEVDGLVGFSATLRISGAIQIIGIDDGVPEQTKALNATASLTAPATAMLGTPTYLWKTCTDENYTAPATAAGTGGTTSSFTTAALTPAGTKYYFCEVSTAGHRPAKGPINKIIVT